MKIHPAEQGSQAWIEARCAIPTASEFDSLVTPLFKIKEGEGPKTYLYRKIAEKWGGPLPSFSSFATEQGHLLEEEARREARFELGEDVREVGLCLTDDGRYGCSPDGLIGESGGVEIKAPSAPTHLEYLLTGTLPKEYAAQVHGAMLVTGRPWWKFMSYRRGYPSLILKIERDERFQEILRVALEAFTGTFDRAWDRLIELNGGPPPKREPMVFAHEMRHLQPLTTPLATVPHFSSAIHPIIAAAIDPMLQQSGEPIGNTP